jgi:catechol 2,3-dioxygenase-like lactoylglutathione lyase family enzyme
VAATDSRDRLGITGVHHITLVVGDLDQARDFYEQFLGLEPVARPDYDFAGAWYRCGDLEVHLLVAEEHPGPSRRHIAFESNEFDKVIRSLDNAKVRVVGGPGVRPHDGTRYVFLQDPGGNLVEISSPGS